MNAKRAQRFAVDDKGWFHPGLDPQEQEILESLAAQAMAFLDGDDPASARLYPVAYPGDAKAESEYRALMGEGLRKHHAHALDTLRQTAAADSIAEDEMHLWMAAVENIRLVLGTQLDVQEDAPGIDADDPGAAQFAVYTYLSMLQSEVVDALADTLPPAWDVE